MKTGYVAAIIFMVSFGAGFSIAPGKIDKSIYELAKAHAIRAGKDGLDKCLPDKFIISRIKKINPGSGDISSWETLINEIKIQGIRDIEKETGTFTIHGLCKIGNTKALKTYLKSGVGNYNINARDKNGMTPLAVAMENMDFDSIKTLVKYGADINKTSVINGKETDLIQAAIDFKGSIHSKYIDEIFKLGLNFEHGEKYLVQALSPGKFQFAYSLLPYTDVNAITESGNHIFTEVLKKSEYYREAIDYFLNKEDLVFNNISAESLPLIAAVENKQITAKDISIMIEKGADINLMSSSDYSTALIASVKAGRADLAELLIKKGADLMIKDIKGKTAKDYVKNKNSRLGRLFFN